MTGYEFTTGRSSGYLALTKFLLLFLSLRDHYAGLNLETFLDLFAFFEQTSTPLSYFWFLNVIISLYFQCSLNQLRLQKASKMRIKLRRSLTNHILR